MMDRIEAAIERGRRAKAVLNEPTVMEAMDYISEQLQRQWRSTTAAMSKHREALFHQLAGLDATRAQLKAWVEQGEFEQKKIDKQQDRRLRVVR